MLGFNEIELIQLVIANRQQLRDQLTVRAVQVTADQLQTQLLGAKMPALAYKQYPHVYGTQLKDADLKLLTVMGAAFSLPAGTSRYACNEYEELTMPMAADDAVVDESQLVKITALPAWM